MLGSDDLIGRLDEWLATARADEAVAARARQRWLRVAADESASFAGTLLDLAERGALVLVSTPADRRHRGVLVGVGADFVALRTPQGTGVFLAFAGIASVRVENAGSIPAGDRIVLVELGLAEALAALAPDRPRVLIVSTASTDGVAGELQSVGRDVAVVRPDGDSGAVVYLPLATIAEVRLTG
jgi:hypothetical protein